MGFLRKRAFRELNRDNNPGGDFTMSIIGALMNGTKNGSTFSPAMMEELEPRLLLSSVTASALVDDIDGQYCTSAIKSDAILDSEGLYDLINSGQAVLPLADATPTGERYFLTEEWGGEWSDAEKKPSVPDDELLCWAATASNVLNWTGWGIVDDMTTAKQDFTYFINHWTDEGSFMEYGWHWWFDGTEPTPDDYSYGMGAFVNVPGGDFYSGENFEDYYHESWDETSSLQTIDEYLHNGYGVGLAIYSDYGLAHAITCWGFNYDPANPSDYKGIWVTDSDDDMDMENAPDRLRYYEVDYHNGAWFFDNIYGYSNVYIGCVQGLERNSAFFEPEIDVEVGPLSNVHSLDLGQVVLGQDGTQTVTIRNEGEADLTVSQASGLDAPFTLSPVNGVDAEDDWIIPAKGTMTFEITFSPTAVGVVTDTLTLTNNDTDEGSYEITLQGQGVELATISGQFWDDANFDGINDIGEAKLAGWTAFIDANENGFLDAGEISTVTDGTGNYTFTDIEPGDYRIGQVMQAGWKRTEPADGYYTVTANYDDDIVGKDFGYQPWTSATPQAFAVTEDIAQDGVVEGFDPEDDSMIFAVDTAPSHGTITSFDVNTGDFTYTPDENYNGEDFFTFTATDGVHLSDPATVSITIVPVNDAPTATGGTANADEDVVLAIPLTADDVETPSANMIYTVTTQPANGLVYIEGNTAYYRGKDNYFGPDSFGFTATDLGDPDGVGTSPALTSDEVFITVDVAPVNDLPQAFSQTISQVYKCEPIIIDIVGKDVETARGNLTYGIDTQPLHGSVSINGQTITYTSAIPAGSAGFTDSFLFSVTDTDGGVSTGTIFLELQADGSWVDIEYGWNIQYTEVDGTSVLIQPRGVWGSLYFEGQNIKPIYGAGNVLEITGQNIQLGIVNLTGSLPTGKLIFKTDSMGDGLARVGEIRGVDPMYHLYGPTVDLVGNGIDMSDDGFIYKVKLHDLLNNANVTMAGDGAARGISFYAHEIASGLTLDFASPVRTLSVASWVGGTLNAPAALYVYTTGDRTAGIAGDLEIDMNLTGEFHGYSLYRAKIANDITGGTWDLAGKAGTIIARTTSETWDLFCTGVYTVYTYGDLAGTIVSSGSIGSMIAGGNLGQAGADLTIQAGGANARGVGITKIQAGGSVLGDNVEITANGGIYSVNVGDWTAEAGSQILDVSWVASLVSRGDFAADVRLDGSNRGYAIQKAKVGGDITGGGWAVRDGNVGTIVAGNTMGNWSLSVNGSIRTLYSYGDLAGMIETHGQAGWIGTIAARGDLGQENKSLILRALGQNARGASISVLKGGSILGSNVEITAGSGINSINVADWSAESGRHNLRAGTVGSLIVRGDNAQGVAGNFTPSKVTLTDQTRNYSLIRSWIAGDWDHDNWSHNNGKIVVGRDVLEATA